MTCGRPQLQNEGFHDKPNVNYFCFENRILIFLQFHVICMLQE